MSAAGYIGEARLAEGRVGEGASETLRALADGAADVNTVPRLVAQPVAAADDSSSDVDAVPRLVAQPLVTVDGSSDVLVIPEVSSDVRAGADSAAEVNAVPRLVARPTVAVDGFSDVLAVPDDLPADDVRASADGGAEVSVVPRLVALPTVAVDGSSAVEVLTEREGVHAEGSSTVEVTPMVLVAGGWVEVWGAALVDVRWTGRLRQPARFAQRRAREFGAPREKIGA